jgi:hypothetical protein
MEIQKSDAAFTLAVIDAAGARSTQLQRYRRFAPFLILWGVIWLLANSLSDLAPAHSGTVWLALTLLGTSVNCWLGWRQHTASADDSTPRTRLDQGWLPHS